MLAINRDKKKRLCGCRRLGGRDVLKGIKDVTGKFEDEPKITFDGIVSQLLFCGGHLRSGFAGNSFVDSYMINCVLFTRLVTGKIISILVDFGLLLVARYIKNYFRESSQCQ